ncbi:probable phospholipase A2 homolog 1 [Pistacia vera]|uniref:probable phospholipase A2 homolog 1 n=1 Tax=Pistacia vera TaxID=55513 RepID=UPI001263C0C5|nr:probable phospholipase A2 homolog 1 [Pistacia vera]
MLRGAVRPVLTRVVAVFAFIFIFSVVLSECAKNDSQVKCSRTCVAQNCNSVGIRYGKYCGVGWTGCPGEKPCDDLDACCKIHDECVEKKGTITSTCIGY